MRRYRLFSNVKRRTLKKKKPPFLGGTKYTWKSYSVMFDVVSMLRPGHIIWNTQRQKWETIKRAEKSEITYNKPNFCLYEFSFVTETGYCIYEMQHWHNVIDFTSDVPSFIEGVYRFNRQIGKPDAWNPIQPDWLQLAQERQNLLTVNAAELAKSVSQSRMALDLWHALQAAPEARKTKGGSLVSRAWQKLGPPNRAIGAHPKHMVWDRDGYSLFVSDIYGPWVEVPRGSSATAAAEAQRQALTALRGEE